MIKFDKIWNKFLIACILEIKKKSILPKNADTTLLHSHNDLKDYLFQKCKIIFCHSSEWCLFMQVNGSADVLFSYKYTMWSIRFYRYGTVPLIPSSQNAYARVFMIVKSYPIMSDRAIVIGHLHWNKTGECHPKSVRPIGVVWQEFTK